MPELTPMRNKTIYQLIKIGAYKGNKDNQQPTNLNPKIKPLK